MKRSRSAVVLTAFALLGALTANSGCEESDASTDETVGELSKLVTVVAGDPIWKIGRANGSENEVFGKVGGAAFVGTGIAIADEQSNLIHWYDSAGTHIVSQGGKGGGPDEFTSLHTVTALPDGSLAALDRAGFIKLFGSDGQLRGSVSFPGGPKEMCMLGSTFVVHGRMSGSDKPMFVRGVTDTIWSSVGETTIPASMQTEGDKGRELLAAAFNDGSVGCVGDLIVYARSSDGTVTGMKADGSVIWQIKLPSFTAIELQPKDGGVLHRSGAAVTNLFAGITPVGSAVVVQVLNADNKTEALRRQGKVPESTRTIWLTSVQLDAKNGKVIGQDDTFPRLLAASGDRIAVARDSPVPEVAIYPIVPR
jgi:hypothetical protein